MLKKKAPTDAKATSTTGEESLLPVRNDVRHLRCERKWAQMRLVQLSRLSKRTIPRIKTSQRTAWLVLALFLSAVAAHDSGLLTVS